jgi:hypothetical protein
MNPIQIRDHLEAVIAPVRVADIWTTPMGITASVPEVLGDEKQALIAHATGAHKVDLVRYPGRTLIFLEMP